MAKKKNDGGSFLGFMLLVLVVMIVITPVVLIIGYIYNFVKSTSLKSNLKNNISDFWLNDSEKTIFKDTYQELSNVLKIIDQTHLQAENAGISKIRMVDILGKVILVKK